LPEETPPEIPAPEQVPEPAGTETGTAAGTASRQEPGLKKIMVLVDDVGNNVFQLDPYLAFPGDLTFAVLPGLPFTRAAAERIREHGVDILLHQPMESVNGNNMGPGGLYSAATGDEIDRILEKNLADLPDAVGINNHMGSAVTADRTIMERVLRFAQKQSLFFIDSLTSENSVVGEVSAELGVPYVKRQIFLDNQCSEDYIREAVQSGLALAEDRGFVIMIGHVQCGALADYLTAHYKEIVEKGFIFTSITDFILDAYDNSRN
ncbi:MAG: divergent polysaccharide deacetylase family protein, partial [Spirochaetales bacterium]